MNDLQFQYPEAFWLLGFLPFFLLLYFIYRAWRRKAMRRIGDPQLVKELFPNHAPRRSWVRIFLLLMVFALGCLAIANPRRPDQSAEGVRKGIDIVVAMDVSNSMLATDIAPDRISRARQFVSRLLENLQDDRTGLVVFAGNAYAQMPLTFDRDAAKMYVSNASPGDIAAQGTSMGEALEKSNLLFSDDPGRFRSVILITDGETHDENAIEKAKELAGRGVMINTIGIGSPEGATILDSTGNPKKDETGQVVVSKLNEQLLQEIAKSTNGVYVHLQNSEEAVKSVLGQYSQIERKALGDQSLMNFETYYFWLAAPMLLLLLIEIFLPDRKKIRR